LINSLLKGFPLSNAQGSATQGPVVSENPDAQAFTNELIATLGKGAQFGTQPQLVNSEMSAEDQKALISNIVKALQSQDQTEEEQSVMQTPVIPLQGLPVQSPQVVPQPSLFAVKNPQQSGDLLASPGLDEISKDLAQSLLQAASNDPNSLALGSSEVNKLINHALLESQQFTESGVIDSKEVMGNLTTELQKKGLSDKALNEVSSKLAALSVKANLESIKNSKEQNQFNQVKGSANFGAEEYLALKSALSQKPQVPQQQVQSQPNKNVELVSFASKIASEKPSVIQAELGNTGSNLTEDFKQNHRNKFEASLSGAQGLNVVPGSPQQVSKEHSLSTKTISLEGAYSAPGKVDYDALQEKLTQMVGRESEMLIGQGGGKLRIQLKPANLGKIDITVETNKDRVDVKLIAENAQVKDLIQNHLSDLKNGLGSQSLKLAHFNIDIQNASPSQFSGDQQHANQQRQNGQGNREFFQEQHAQHQERREREARQEYEARDLNQDVFKGRGMLGAKKPAFSQAATESSTRAARKDFQALNAKI